MYNSTLEWKYQYGGFPLWLKTIGHNNTACNALATDGFKQQFSYYLVNEIVFINDPLITWTERASHTRFGNV